MQLEKIGNKSKMYLVVSMTSMMITICLIFGDWIAWLIPYSIAKSLALYNIHCIANCFSNDIITIAYVTILAMSSGYT